MPLILTESSFQGLLEAAPDAFIIVDSDGIIILVNTQAERLFGYDRDELIGQAVELLIPMRMRPNHHHHRDSYMADPHTRPMGLGLDLLARRRDGSEFHVEISLSPFPTANSMLVTAVVRDITDRKRAADELERQVRQRTAHLNALLQFSGDLLLARTIDEVLNRALHHVLALINDAQHAAIYLHEEATDQLVLRASAGLDLLPPTIVSADNGPIWRAFATSQRQYIPSTIAQPLIAQTRPIGVLIIMQSQDNGNAESFPTLEGLANLTASALVQELNRSRAVTLTNMVATLEDQQRLMAERLTTAEAAMLQSARLAAMGQLAASIAHEINNPLYAARNALYLVEDDSGETPYLTLAREQLDRIAGIIERMRDFYRPQRGEFASVDLNRLIQETLKLAELNVRPGAIEIIFEPQPDLPLVHGVADQLRQVVLNILLNAIDAMPQGGTLRVDTALQSSTVVLSIHDTGIGIPTDALPKLFEPFFTTKTHGTGLGLAISAHIVELHQGRIDVVSNPETGTTFHIALPMDKEQA